jgi:branched-chain amino acid transport system permease protein
MSQILLFVILGLGPGALIAGLALGVVLNYRASGMVNLAVGGVAMIGAYVFYGLKTGGYLWLPPFPFAPDRVGLGGPWATVPALAVALGVSGLIGVVMELLVVRPLRQATPLSKLLASLGVLSILQAAVVLRFGSTGQSAPAALPNGPSDVVRVFGTLLPSAQLIIPCIVIFITVVLVAVYRFTRFGLAARAAQDNEVGALLAGLSPNTLSMTSTVLGCLLAGGLGVLVAPSTQLDSTTIALMIIPALGAAVLASFTSFGIAAAAGLFMGVIQSLLIYLQTKSWFPTAGGAALPGLDVLTYFLIIVVAMFLRGSKLPQRGALVHKRLPIAPPVRRITRPTVIGGVACVVALLVFPFDFRQALINSMIGMIVCLSLVVIIGFVGQLSLAQLALSGVAALLVSKVAIHLGLGFPIGPIIGVGAATLLGVATAVPALRVRGVNLAIVSVAVAVAIENFWFDNSSWAAGTSGAAPVPTPHLFGLDLGVNAHFLFTGSNVPSPVFGFVCLVAVIGVVLLVAGLRSSSLGQRMLAVRANERVAAGAGIDVRGVKLTAFAISSFIAGIAGVLYAYDYTAVAASQYDIVAGLAFVGFAYIGGITSITGAVIAGLGVTDGLISHASQKWLGIPIEYQLFIAGIALVMTVVMRPEGIAGHSDSDPILKLARFLIRRVRAQTAAPPQVLLDSKEPRP